MGFLCLPKYIPWWNYMYPTKEITFSSALCFDGASWCTYTISVALKNDDEEANMGHWNF